MLKGDCKSIILRIKVQGISRTHVSNNMRTSFGEWPESVFCRVSSRLVRPFFGLMCLFFLIGITITHTHPPPFVYRKSLVPRSHLEVASVKLPWLWMNVLSTSFCAQATTLRMWDNVRKGEVGQRSPPCEPSVNHR